MNRLLVFLMLAGLLYALYRYQHIIFGPQPTPPVKHKPGKIEYKQRENKNVSVDNISQMSLGSLDEEDGKKEVYKMDSLLDSLDSGTAIDSLDSGGTIETRDTRDTANSSFFF